jgi:hypothetical protein
MVGGECKLRILFQAISAGYLYVTDFFALAGYVRSGDSPYEMRCIFGEKRKPLYSRKSALLPHSTGIKRLSEADGNGKALVAALSRADNASNGRVTASNACLRPFGCKDL